jgi:predicted transcriptional regulator of viral defense system
MPGPEFLALHLFSEAGQGMFRWATAACFISWLALWYALTERQPARVIVQTSRDKQRKKANTSRSAISENFLESSVFKKSARPAWSVTR